MDCSSVTFKILLFFYQLSTYEVQVHDTHYYDLQFVMYQWSYKLQYEKNIKTTLIV